MKQQFSTLGVAVTLAYRTDGDDLADGASAAVCKSELDDLLTAVGATGEHLQFCSTIFARGCRRSWSGSALPLRRPRIWPRT
jgi:hypothetical protein